MIKVRITQEADYGLRVILYLSRLEPGDRVEARTIAEAEVIPIRFLLKLLRKLIATNIVKSYRGVKGGYSLNKAKEEISLKAVIEAIDGPIIINRCLENPKLCTANKGTKCSIHKALNEIQTKLEKDLEAVKFSDFEA